MQREIQKPEINRNIASGGGISESKIVFCSSMNPLSLLYEFLFAVMLAIASGALQPAKLARLTLWCTHICTDCAKLCALANQDCFGRESWQTTKSARTHHARAHRNQTENTVVLRAKEQVRRSSW